MKKGITVIILLLCIFIGIGTFWLTSMKDKNAPEILFLSEQIVYEEGDQETLLKDVRALDDRDDDVTDSIRIKGIFPNKKGDKVKVIYVAKDKSNNVSKVTKEVLVMTEETDINGGNVDELVTETSAIGISMAETPQNVEPTSTPEVLMTPMLSVSPEVLPGAPEITLIDSNVTISVGAFANRISYVQDISDDKDERNSLFRQIQILGEINTAVIGDYKLIYYVIDSDGNRSNEAELVVLVR